ncbi:hypothetical protein VYU27_010776, partial [Nannochloropsis oceanica]
MSLLIRPSNRGSFPASASPYEGGWEGGWEGGKEEEGMGEVERQHEQRQEQRQQQQQQQYDKHQQQQYDKHQQQQKEREKAATLDFSFLPQKAKWEEGGREGRREGGRIRTKWKEAKGEGEGDEEEEEMVGCVSFLPVFNRKVRESFSFLSNRGGREEGRRYAVVYQGWLLKAAAHIPRWKWRHFRLCSDGVLRYYSSDGLPYRGS